MRVAMPPLPQYALMSWCSKHSGNFTLPLPMIKDRAMKTYFAGGIVRRTLNLDIRLRCVVSFTLRPLIAFFSSFLYSDQEQCLQEQ
jgi:hypothetical protein